MNYPGIDVEQIRKDAWVFLCEDVYTPHAFAKEIGIGQQTLQAFLDPKELRGLNMRTVLKVNRWLKKRRKLDADKEIREAQARCFTAVNPEEQASSVGSQGA